MKWCFTASMRDYRRMNQAGQQGDTPETDVPAPDGAPDPAFKPVLKPAAAKRANATVIGMLMALGVSLAIALLLPLLSPHPNTQFKPQTDVSGAATEAAGIAGFAPVAPALPAGWSANYARWNAAGSDGVAFWEIGFVTPAQQFISVTQTAQANPTWLAGRTDNAPVTGDRQVAGSSWQLRDKPGTSTSYISNPVSPTAPASPGSTSIVVKGETKSGSFSLDDLDTVAAAVVASQTNSQSSATPSGSGK